MSYALLAISVPVTAPVQWTASHRNLDVFEKGSFMEDTSRNVDGELAASLHPVATFAVVEERLDVSKKAVETGAVRV